MNAQKLRQFSKILTLTSCWGPYAFDYSIRHNHRKIRIKSNDTIIDIYGAFSHTHASISHNMAKWTLCFVAQCCQYRFHIWFWWRYEMDLSIFIPVDQWKYIFNGLLSVLVLLCNFNWPMYITDLLLLHLRQRNG